MNCAETVKVLKDGVETSLTPLITADYWLMEIPHYDNVGDTLIWQGEMDFLKGLPYKCRGMRALDSWRSADIKDGEMILFQGGGNFGDLWCKHHDFKMKVVAEHPKNKFLFFPQTVYFEHEENLRKCAEFLSHYDATICARDQVSYELIKANFKNEILLVPDMAFCMDMSKWARKTYQPKFPLLLKRMDKEFRDCAAINEVLKIPGIDVADWVTMMDKGCVDRWLWRIQARPRKLGWLYDPYMYYIYRSYLIQSGVDQVMQHTDIYTTRLHTCILSILLGKEKITFFDNSYGKNRNFYVTWLRDCANVRMET